MQGGRRNFPLRSRALGGDWELLVEEAAFLQVITMLHTGQPQRLNIPNILILGVQLSIPKKTQTRSFPEDFLKIKPQNKSLYLYPPDLLAS